MNSFLCPLVEMLNSTYINVIDIDSNLVNFKKVSIVTLVFILDLKTKCSIQKFIEPNGYCGCLLCENPGIHSDNAYYFPLTIDLDHFSNNFKTKYYVDQNIFIGSKIQQKLRKRCQRVEHYIRINYCRYH